MVADEKQKDGEQGLVAASIESAKDVVLEVYRDGVKETVQAVGSAISLAARVALSPLVLVLRTAELATENLFKRAFGKVESVPPDARLLPDPSLSGPIILNHSLLGERSDVEELRDMYASLLASSLDPATVHQAHPSYPHIIQQMSVVEAKILKLASEAPAVFWPVIQVRERVPSVPGISDGRGYLVGLGAGLGLTVADHDAAILNLERLGLMNRYEYAVRGPLDSLYEPLERDMLTLPEFQTTGGEIFAVRYALSLTRLGFRFMNTCIR